MDLSGNDIDLSGNLLLDLSYNDLSGVSTLVDLSDQLQFNSSQLDFGEYDDMIFFDKDFLTLTGDRLYYSVTVDGVNVSEVSWITFQKGKFTFSPSSSNVGNYVVNITVKDLSDASASTSFNVNVHSSSVFSGNTSGTGQANTEITGTLNVTDANDISNPNFVISLNSTRGEALIDAQSGVWTFNPILNWSGITTFEVTVTDDLGETTSQLVTLTVNPVTVVTVAFRLKGINLDELNNEAQTNIINDVRSSYATQNSINEDNVVVNLSNGSLIVIVTIKFEGTESENTSNINLITNNVESIKTNITSIVKEVAETNDLNVTNISLDDQYNGMTPDIDDGSPILAPQVLNTVANLTFNKTSTSDVFTYTLPEFGHNGNLDDKLTDLASGNTDGNFSVTLNLNDLETKFGISDNFYYTRNKNDLGALSTSLFVDASFLTTAGETLYYKAEIDGYNVDSLSWVTFNAGVLSFDKKNTPNGSHTVTLSVKDSSNLTTSLSFNVVANSVATGTISFTGTLKEDEMLSAFISLDNPINDIDGMGSPLNFQWQSSNDLSTWDDLSTGTTITLGQQQVGKYMRLVVSFTDLLGSVETIVSTVQGPVLNVDDPTVWSGDFTGVGDEDTQITGTVSVTDEDGAVSLPIFEISAQPTNGRASINQSGVWTYNPNANYYGSDLFTIKFTDDLGGVVYRDVTLVINSVHDAPVMQDINLTKLPGTYTVNLLDYVTDGDGVDNSNHPISFYEENLTTLNSVQGNLYSSGSIGIYFNVENLSQLPIDLTQLKYGALGSSWAQGPRILNVFTRPGGYQTDSDTATWVANEGEWTQVGTDISVTIPAGGTQTSPVFSDSFVITKVTIQPREVVGFFIYGDQTIQYMAANNAGPINSIVNSDSSLAIRSGWGTYITTPGQLGAYQPRAPVVEISDGEADLYTLIDQNLEVTLDNREEQFVYDKPIVAFDGISYSNSATLTITNARPIVTAQSLTVNEDSSGTAFNATLPTSDHRGLPLTYTVTSPSNGTLVFDNTNNSLTYTPNANFNGNDSFNVVANNRVHDSLPTTFNVTVNQVNDSGVGTLTIGGGTLDEGQRLALSGHESISDIDGISTPGKIRWLRNGNEIYGENNRRYKLMEQDANNMISASYTYTDDDGNEQVFTSNSLGPVNGAPQLLNKIDNIDILDLNHVTYKLPEFEKLGGSSVSSVPSSFTDEFQRWTGNDGYTYVINEHKPTSSNIGQEVAQAFAEGLEWLDIPANILSTFSTSLLLSVIPTTVLNNVGGVDLESLLHDLWLNREDISNDSIYLYIGNDSTHYHVYTYMGSNITNSRIFTNTAHNILDFSSETEYSGPNRYWLYRYSGTNSNAVVDFSSDSSVEYSVTLKANQSSLTDAGLPSPATKSFENMVETWNHNGYTYGLWNHHPSENTFQDEYVELILSGWELIPRSLIPANWQETFEGKQISELREMITPDSWNNMANWGTGSDDEYQMRIYFLPDDQLPGYQQLSPYAGKDGNFPENYRFSNLWPSGDDSVRSSEAYGFYWNRAQAQWNLSNNTWTTIGDEIDSEGVRGIEKYYVVRKQQSNLDRDLGDLNNFKFFDFSWLSNAGDKLYYTAKVDGVNVKDLSWVSFVNGEFGFTPDSSNNGGHKVELIVKDNRGIESSTTFMVDVNEAPVLLNKVDDIVINNYEQVTYTLPEFVNYKGLMDLSDNYFGLTHVNTDLSEVMFYDLSGSHNFGIDLSLNDLSNNSNPLGMNFNLSNLDLSKPLNQLDLKDLNKAIFFDKNFLSDAGERLFYSATLNGKNIEDSRWITFRLGTFVFNPTTENSGTHEIILTVRDDRNKSTSTKFNLIVDVPPVVADINLAGIEGIHYVNLLDYTTDRDLTQMKFYDLEDNEISSNYKVTLLEGQKEFKMSFKASDGEVFSGVGTLTFTNTRPLLNNKSYIGSEDKPLLMELDKFDHRGLPLRYSFTDPANGALNYEDGFLTYLTNKDYNGEDSFVLTANNGENNSLPVTFNLTLQAVNDPSVMKPINLIMLKGESLELDLTKFTSDVDSSEFVWSVPSNKGMFTVNGSNLLITLSDENIDDISQTINVYDGEFTVSGLINIYINNPPFFITQELPNGKEDEEFNFDIQIGDDDLDQEEILDSLEVIAVELPEWLSFENNKLSGKPLNKHRGNNKITLAVSDLSDNEVIKVFNIFVENTDDEAIGFIEIIGEVKTSKTLSANINNIRDVDGEIYVSKYSWEVSFDNVTFTKISEEELYTVETCYYHKFLRLTLETTDSEGGKSLFTSDSHLIEDGYGPVLVINGDIEMTLEGGNSMYTELGAYAVDAVDGPVDVKIEGSVNVNKVGKYEVKYSASDKSDNVTTLVRVINVVDTMAPVLELNGEAEIILEVGEEYIELGASATDLVDSNLDIVIEGEVNMNVGGNYKLTYSVSDKSGNSSSLVRLVNVIDTTAPVITLNGDAEITLEAGEEYIELGATGTDLSENLLVSISGEVNNLVPGQYVVTYSTTDNVGNESNSVRLVNIVDTTSPVLTLNGDVIVTLEVGTSYEELGASANDIVDGIVEVLIKGEVNSEVVNVYNLTYSATDKEGNVSSLTRVVNIVDTTAPKLILNGSSVVTHEAGLPYVDAGVNVNDNYDKEISVTIEGEVNSNLLGEYTLIYTAEDSNKNKTQLVRLVKVVDTIAPILTLKGDANVTVEAGTTFVDEGAYATDLVDGEVEVVVEGEYNINVIGTYIITYSASDKSGNTSSLIRIINVIDTTAPEMELVGSPVMTLEAGSEYVELGVNAYDLGNTVKVEISGEVNNLVPGQYVLTYTSNDFVGNMNSIVRLVNVVDTIAPVITLNGSAVITHIAGTLYNDEGANALDLVDGKVDVLVEGIVNHNLVGIYTLKYSTKDKAGNTSELIRIVNVKDINNKLIRLNGEFDITIEAGDTYVDLGVSVFDPSKHITIKLCGKVNTLVEGEYNLFYLAMDDEGNTESLARIVRVIDTIPPTITLNGPSEVTHEGGMPFTDEGASANDVVEVITSGFVNVYKLGEYTLVYLATDKAGNVSSVRRIVNVVDTNEPIISLNGDSEINHELGDSYLDDGANAFDLVDGIVDVKVEGEVNGFKLGKYTLTYSAEDKSGNKSSLTRTVNVIDSAAPVITLNGATELTLEAGEEYIELGANATDLSENLTVSMSGEVNNLVPGQYEIVYLASDNVGNTASVTRKVRIVDTTAPVMSLNGQSILTLEVGSKYEELGATALDIVDGNVSVEINGLVDMNKVGTYTLTYKSKDSSGNSSTLIRAINIQDTTAPLVTLNGEAEITLEGGANYVELGASATDLSDNLVVSINGEVNNLVLGQYLIKYNAFDNVGNEGIAIRLVSVVDTTEPVLTLNGQITINHEIDTLFVDPGSSAYDIMDGSIDVIVSGYVNTSIIGEYELSYSATDKSGNNTRATRIVNVVDTTAPVLKLYGDSIMTHEAGTPFIDPGSIAIDRNNVSVNVLVIGSVDIFNPNDYFLTYTATDNSGNSVSLTRKVTVIDTIAPVIQLNGNFFESVEAGNEYVDAGATASDLCDGNVEVMVEGEVNNLLPGNYTLTYNATDKAGNSSSLVRVVNIIDTTAPTMTLIGDQIVTLEAGTPYTELGVVATDLGEELTVIGGVCNNLVPGQYVLTYYSNDKSGNQGSIVRVVNVVDTTGPEITLNGDEVFNHEYGTPYLDEGAFALDIVDGMVEVTISGNVNIDVLGEYKLEYSATDKSGNKSVKLRTVNVVDTLAPTIILNGDQIYNHEFGKSYIELGARAFDEIDGEVEVVINGEVRKDIVGTYSIKYTAVDSSGNKSEVIRIVNVMKTEKEQIINFDSNNRAASVYIESKVIDIYTKYADSLVSIISPAEGKSFLADNIKSGLEMFNTLDKLDLEFGYWFKFNKNTTVNLSGYMPNEVTLNIPGNKWHLMGYPSTRKLSIKELLQDNINNVEKIINPTDGTSWVLENENSGFDMFNTLKEFSQNENGVAYWIYSNKDIELHIDNTVQDPESSKSSQSRGLYINPHPFTAITTYTNPPCLLRAYVTIDDEQCKLGDVIALYTGDELRCISYVQVSETGKSFISGNIEIANGSSIEVINKIEIFDSSKNVIVPVNNVNIFIQSGEVTEILNINGLVDTEAPIITLNGSQVIVLKLDQNFIDPGATAIDNIDGDVTSNIIISGEVNSSISGTYFITYKIKDSNGNMGMITRKVIVDEEEHLGELQLLSDVDGECVYSFSVESQIEYNISFNGLPSWVEYKIDGPVHLLISRAGLNNVGAHTFSVVFSNSNTIEEKEYMIDIKANCLNNGYTFDFNNDTVDISNMFSNVENIQSAKLKVILSESDKLFTPITIESNKTATAEFVNIKFNDELSDKLVELEIITEDAFKPEFMKYKNLNLIERVSMEELESSFVPNRWARQEWNSYKVVFQGYMRDLHMNNGCVQEDFDAGICEDPHILTMGGNRLDLPHDDNIYNMIDGLGLKINVKSQILGNGSYAKYFYVSYQGDEFILDIEDLELKEKSSNIKTKYHMLEQTDYTGNNFVFEKKMRTLFINSTDGVMELTFNAETRGLLIKSRLNFTQENSSGIMMSSSIDECLRSNVDE